MRSASRLYVAALALFYGISACQLFGQTVQGRISVVVADLSGDSVVNAQVILMNSKTEATRTTKSDPSGDYVIESVPLGGGRSA